ncbi:MAG TPA: FAD-binding protein, partial [Fimbriimonadaceae bacterium]|nr:FAD-binding protein [Fimbriimonadaceae bacterium]
MTTGTDPVLLRDLSLIVGTEHVLHGAGVERAYDCDAYSVEKSKPTCVVLPESTEQVQAVVRWCVQNDVPFTARGAGTGLSGGVLPALGGVVISTKRMTRILEIDIPNRCMLAQAGAVNKKLSDAVADQGLHFAPDPSSQTVSTLGGNIAENSGGPHTLKYGVTVNHVLQVKMVLPDGELTTIGSRVSGGPGLDLLGLVIGAEGTLGVVTEAWVKLTPNPAAVKTALAAYPSIAGATRTVAELIASGTIPAALEIMDHGILAALRAAFGLKYPDEAEALLLIECDGSPQSVSEDMNVVEAVCTANGALHLAVAKDEKERQELWTARKKGIGAMGRLAPTIVTHDGVIPRSKLPEVLDFVYATAQKHELG